MIPKKTTQTTQPRSAIPWPHWSAGWRWCETPRRGKSDENASRCAWGRRWRDVVLTLAGVPQAPGRQSACNRGLRLVLRQNSQTQLSSTLPLTARPQQGGPGTQGSTPGPQRWWRDGHSHATDHACAWHARSARARTYGKRIVDRHGLRRRGGRQLCRSYTSAAATSTAATTAPWNELGNQRRRRLPGLGRRLIEQRVRTTSQRPAQLRSRGPAAPRPRR